MTLEVVRPHFEVAYGAGGLPVPVGTDGAASEGGGADVGEVGGGRWVHSVSIGLYTYQRVLKLITNHFTHNRLS